MDEDLERQEQEALARREAAMMELANAQEQEEEEARRREMIERGLAEERGEGEEGEEGEEEDEEEGGGEVDLDADVPDLDADVPEGSLGAGSEEEEEDEEDEDENEDEDEDDEEEEVTEEEVTGEVTQDVTFNEESMYGDASLLGEEHDEDVENAQQWVEREEAEMAGDLQDERDLDDDIPEAGEYEHTDTELEDITEDDLRNSGLSVSGLSSRRRSSRRGGTGISRLENTGPFGRSSGGRQATGVPAFNLNRRPLRGSFHSEGPSSLLGDESSFLENSPNAGRGLGRAGPSWMQPPPRPTWRRGPQ
ncbi:hypothetical protein MPH_11694 [Macrophomina phaseolina MS6]|uniref:Uncharacterized protein n=2 Tax=Macrophomina phaseolina TaxID=35725 RepID=K2R9S4_MACPH|nr:hypothetical protein MPH_11694 [Macrophomina phaseolina MS6]